MKSRFARSGSTPKRRAAITSKASPDALARIVSLAPVSTAAAVVTVVGAIVGGAFMADGYSSVGETISQLTDPGAPAAGLVRGGILAYSLMLVPLAVALLRGGPDGLPFRRLAGLALCFHVAGAIVASAFANDSPRTFLDGVTFDAVHDRAGQVLYVAAIAATFFLASSAAVRARPRSLVAVASALAFAVTLFSGISLFFDLYPTIAGLEERTGLGAFQVWLVLVSRWREQNHRFFMSAGRALMCSSCLPAQTDAGTAPVRRRRVP